MIMAVSNGSGNEEKDRLKNQLVFFFVVSPGFEPRQTVPKTVVLPLHHETIRGFLSKALQK